MIGEIEEMKFEDVTKKQINNINNRTKKFLREMKLVNGEDLDVVLTSLHGIVVKNASFEKRFRIHKFASGKYKFKLEIPDVDNVEGERKIIAFLIAKLVLEFNVTSKKWLYLDEGILYDNYNKDADEFIDLVSEDDIKAKIFAFALLMSSKADIRKITNVKHSSLLYNNKEERIEDLIKGKLKWRR